MLSSVGKSWFLGIGINKYQDFYQLENAGKDVEELKALLQDKYDLNDNESIVLKEPEATRKDILDAFKSLTRKAQEDDKVLIVFAGHGTLDEEGNQHRGFWIPVDGKKDDDTTWIPNSRIKDYIEDFKCRHVLLIADSCFSGSLIITRGIGLDQSKNNPHPEINGLTKMEEAPSRWIIASGNQIVQDGKPGKHSPFMRVLLRKLREHEDRPGLNIGLLFDEVSKAEELKHQQPLRRLLYDAGDKGGQYVFWSSHSPLPEQTDLRPSLRRISPPAENDSLPLRKRQLFRLLIVLVSSWLILLAAVSVNAMGELPYFKVIAILTILSLILIWFQETATYSAILALAPQLMLWKELGLIDNLWSYGVSIVALMLTITIAALSFPYIIPLSRIPAFLLAKTKREPD